MFFLQEPLSQKISNMYALQLSDLVQIQIFSKLLLPEVGWGYNRESIKSFGFFSTCE
jgi:hypothetical protein